MNSFQFCRELPKAELHAHLNGSLSAKTLTELGCLKENINEYQKLTRLLKKNEKTLEECFDLFKVAQNATNTKDNVYLAMESVIKDFSKENVIYLEIRTTPRTEKDMTKREYIESVVKAIKENTNNIIVKLILSIDRRHDNRTSFDTMKLFKEMKLIYPNIIKAVDFSGNPLAGCFDETLFQDARANGFYTTLHCAEIKNDNEVENILKFKPDRLGHATFLHPEHGGNLKNWNLYCQNKIPVECCLTSNVVCGTSHDYKSHHLGKWIQSEMPFTLCTDDKGVFTTSLTEEFMHAKENFCLSNQQLWQISYNSIEYSFASEEEKMILRNCLKDWRLKHQM